MNILPKKNWHVRKKENIARVRRDEAEAAEKEEETQRRAKLAEQEARLAFLRQNAREKGSEFSPEYNSSPGKEPSNTEADIFTSEGNINFFKEAESGKTQSGSNKEYEEEKKLEKEDYEKKIGLLTYLGQDSYEATGKTAWFNEREHLISRKGSNLKDENEVNLKSKSKLDPMNEMRKHSNIIFYPKVENFGSNPQVTSEVVKESKSKSLCRKNKKHKREKHKKRKRKRALSSDSETESRKPSKKKHSKKKKKRKEDNSDDDDEDKRRKLLKLREERLKREARERKREERLIAGKNPDVDEAEEAKHNLPYKQKYNSQFNPHIAKQNQDRQPTEAISTLQAGVKYWLS